MPRLKVDLDSWEDVLGEPIGEWDGRCHEIACRIVRCGLIAGKAVYGHYRGPIARGSRWTRYRSVGFVRHGWIVTDDNKIIDPLRWSFENVSPYIYETRLDPKTGLNDEYDEGGNVLRKQLMTPCPSARQKPSDRVRLSFDLRTTPSFVSALIDDTCGDANLTMAQVFWLANLPLTVLGDFADDIYAAICRAGHQAFIPIDNRRKVLCGRK